MAIKKRSQLVEVNQDQQVGMVVRFNAVDEAIDRYRKVCFLADESNDPELLVKAADIAVRLADLSLKEKKINVDASKHTRVFNLKKINPSNGQKA